MDQANAPYYHEMTEQGIRYSQDTKTLTIVAAQCYASHFCAYLDKNKSKFIEFEDLKNNLPGNPDEYIKQVMLDVKPCGSPVDFHTYIEICGKYSQDPKSVPNTWATLLDGVYTSPEQRTLEGQNMLRELRMEADRGIEASRRNYEACAPPELKTQ